MRNATLRDLEQILRKQHAEKVDLVVPATSLRAKDGQIKVTGADNFLVEGFGFMDPNGLYKPSDVFVEGLADKLKIPMQYLRRTQEDAPDLFDANVNGWLHGKSVRRAGQDEPSVLRNPDSRKFLFRAFRDFSEDGHAVARALLSDSFGPMENLDVLVAALEGIKDAGVHVDPDSIVCDLSDRRMYMRIPAPELFVEAPELLKGYVSPFEDPETDRARRFEGNGGSQTATALERGRQRLAEIAGGKPIVFAGLDFRNSEVGQSQFEIRPIVIIESCSNGMTITKEAAKRRHVGSKLEEGTIRWSDDTVQKAVELIKAKTRDTVASFLTQEFLETTVAGLEEQAGVKVRDVEATVKHVSTKLSFSESERAGILAHFIAGHQLTAGGMAQAVTSYSQTVQNADRARHLDDKALEVLDLAASM